MGGLGRTPEQTGFNARLEEAVAGQIDFQGGDEHFISLPAADSPDRVPKWTCGYNFGLCLKVFEVDPDAMNRHVISTGNPDPRYYLNRWIILNGIAPPITRFEGLLPPDFLKSEKLPRLAISQRFLTPDNPSRREIIRGFREIGFIEVSEHAYYRIVDNILLGDAAPRTSESNTEPSDPSMPSRNIPLVRQGIGVPEKRNAAHDLGGGLHPPCRVTNPGVVNGMAYEIRRQGSICHH